MGTVLSSEEIDLVNSVHWDSSYSKVRKYVDIYRVPRWRDVFDRVFPSQSRQLMCIGNYRLYYNRVWMPWFRIVLSNARHPKKLPMAYCTKID